MRKDLLNFPSGLSLKRVFVIKYALLLFTCCSILLIILSLPVYFFKGSIILSSESLLVTGDFNIHVDVVGDPACAKFLELHILETMGLQQHVNTLTHESGYTLDLILSRQCENLVKTTLVSAYHVSDHWTVTCLLNLDRPGVTSKSVTFRIIIGR